MPTTVYHIPVLLKQSVDGLNIRRDGVYADLTFGGGGHSREILSRLNADGRLYSFDQDADAESNVPANEETHLRAEQFPLFAQLDALLWRGCPRRDIGRPRRVEPPF